MGRHRSVSVPDPRVPDPHGQFPTHLKVGIFVSGGAVLALDGLGLVAPDQTLVLFALGVVGSLLPDIDADASSPVRAYLRHSWAPPWPSAGPCRWSVAIRRWNWPWSGAGSSWRRAFCCCLAFARFTVHRGIWHSWLAAAFAALATVNLAHWFLHQPAKPAWVAGLMVGLGYLTHLCLDEIYSVDIFNTRVRRSFGTALKPFSLSDPVSSLADGRRGGVAGLVRPGGRASIRSRSGPSSIAWADQTLARLAAWLRRGYRGHARLV